MSDDLVDRLNDQRERRLFADALMERAAAIIERHREAFRQDCGMIGYSSEETEEMLTELEAGL